MFFPQFTGKKAQALNLYGGVSSKCAVINAFHFECLLDMAHSGNVTIILMFFFSKKQIISRLIFLMNKLSRDFLIFHELNDAEILNSLQTNTQHRVYTLLV